MRRKPPVSITVVGQEELQSKNKVEVLDILQNVPGIQLSPGPPQDSEYLEAPRTCGISMSVKF
jgi:outer membrane receptor for ferrienterochelin and colicin